MAAQIRAGAGPVYVRVSSGFANRLNYSIYLKNSADAQAPATPVCQHRTEYPATYLLSPTGSELGDDWITWIFYIIDPAGGANVPYNVTVEVIQGNVIVSGGAWSTPPNSRMDGAMTVIDQLDFHVAG
jgi:hypothetical protein